MTDTIPIHPDRLSHGEWKGEKHVGEGDVPASYSGDRICEDQPIRTPFRWGADLWVCVSISGKGLTATGETEMQAYRIVPPAMFNGVETTYRAKVYDGTDGETARNDRMGFYHSMKITHGGKPFIMQGPPAVFVADPTPERPAEPDQLSLFDTAAP
jgi:hypothetical protein